MTTKTRLELVHQALANLGKASAGQGFEVQDEDAVDGHVDQLFAQLRVREIVDVTDDSAIPVEWMGPLAILLADDAAFEFGLPGIPPSASNPNPVMGAETQLRQLTADGPTGEVQRAEYF